MYVSKTLNVGTENITTFGFLFTLISLMLSKYQLPHYIFIVYPLGAVIAADTFVKLSTKQWVRFTQFSLIAVVWTFVGLVNLYVFAISGWLLLLLICCVSVASFIFISSKDLLLLTLASILSCNLLMSLNFFPQLQRYQTSEEIGRYLRNQHIPIEKLMVHYSCFSFALAFYYQDDYASCLAPVDIEQAFKKTNEQYILIDDMNFPILQSHAGWSPVIVKTYYKFKITQLNLAFLNPKTRLNALRKIYLVKLTLNDIH